MSHGESWCLYMRIHGPSTLCNELLTQAYVRSRDTTCLHGQNRHTKNAHIDTQSTLACMQGSACFLTGVVLILIKWALVGICVETYGFWLLFSGFFPTVLGFLRRLPVLGSILDLPILKTVRGSVYWAQSVHFRFLG